MSKLSGIANKLRALRAIAEEGSGATENERLNAAKLYAELLEKTHMDASELELREEGTLHVRVEFGTTGNGFMIGRALCVAVGLFTRCKPWMSSSRGEIHYLGLQSDAEFAEWLTRSLVGHAQGEALAFTMDAEPGRQIFAADVQVFVVSCANRVSERLRGLALQDAFEDNSHALVPVRSKMIDEAWAKMGISLGKSRAVKLSGSDAAMHAGRAAGDRASFGRPVGGTAQLKIGQQ